MGLLLNMYVCMYVCIHVCMYMYVIIYNLETVQFTFRNKITNMWKTYENDDILLLYRIRELP